MQPDPIQVPLAFTGRTAPSRRTSRQGAIVGTVKAGTQASRMLQNYAAGPVSDTDMAYWLGLPEARISARRCGLMVKGLVRYHDDVMGMHGVTVCRWTLTVKGERVAQKIRD